MQQKKQHAGRIKYHQDKQTHARPLMKKLNALNIYQINIFQILVFMFKLSKNMLPNTFHKDFESIFHKYGTTFSSLNVK